MNFEIVRICVHDCDHGSADEPGGTSLKVLPAYSGAFPGVVYLDLDFDIGDRTFSGGIMLHEKDAHAVALAILALLEER